MDFKVGDKVKLCDTFRITQFRGINGVIVNIWKSNYPYDVKVDSTAWCVCKSEELEHRHEPGEQLLLFGAL